jgi:hypothetical protein
MYKFFESSPLRRPPPKVATETRTRGWLFVGIYAALLDRQHLSNMLHDLVCDYLQASLAGNALWQRRSIWFANLDGYLGKPTTASTKYSPGACMCHGQEGGIGAESEHGYASVCRDHLLLPLNSAFGEKDQGFTLA